MASAPRLPPRLPLRHARRGTVLIVAAGLCALIASLALAFLVRMRSDAEESIMVINEVQARLMLMAGCNYIQEASRLGWDKVQLSVTASGQVPGWYHTEGFGWIDVRDGTIGPKDQFGAPVCSASSWMDLPAAGVPPSQRAAFRAPMYVMTRPPFAIQQTVACNPISTTPGDPAYGLPIMANPDPMPVADPTSATFRSDYILGDRSPNARAYVASWFRIYRDGPASFIVSCGAGGTRGWKSWAEITDPILGNPTEAAIFNNDPVLFNSLLNTETRLWYHVEWTAAVHSPDYQTYQNEWGTDHYIWRGMNATQETRSQPHDTNMVGTIRLVQRLATQPTYW